MTSEIGMFASIRDFLGFSTRRAANDKLRQEWQEAQNVLNERDQVNMATIARDKQKELKEALDRNPDYTKARNTQLQGFPIVFTRDNIKYTFTEGGNEEAGTHYASVHSVTYDINGIIEGTAFLHIRTGKTKGQIHFGENNSEPLNGISALPKINEMISQINS